MIQKTHDSLNPKFWDGLNLKTSVRKALLETAIEFHKFLKIKAGVKDVIITGSSSNYNYSEEFSDLDLHVLYDFGEVLSEESEVIDSTDELVAEYLNAKKAIWNDRYDVTINNTTVEVYAQDSNDDTHVASGVFSIVTNKWVKQPQQKEISVDEDLVQQKFESLERLIQHTIKSNIDPSKLKEKIRKFRRAGLDSIEGEFSVENLAFKLLRRKGVLEKLYDYDIERVNKTLSIT